MELDLFTPPVESAFRCFSSPEPAGEWGYDVDDGVVHRVPWLPGLWPFVGLRGGSAIWPLDCDSVRLAPNTEFRSWNNQYVSVYPDESNPDLAVAWPTLYVHEQGMGAMVHEGVALRFDLRAETFTVERCPAELREQAESKARKIMDLLLDHVRRRYQTTAVVTAYDRYVQQPGYCQQHAQLHCWCQKVLPTKPRRR